MSVKRPFIWNCNECGIIEERLGYGLPSKWEWYGGTVREPEIKHRCPECKKKENKKNENVDDKS